MPKYRLHADCFLGDTRHKAGAVVGWDGPPNAHMEPMDEAARAAFAAWIASRKKRGLPEPIRFPFQVIEAKLTGGKMRAPADMTIPDGWRGLKGLALVNLAKRLGAPFGVNLHHARAFIEDMERKQGKALLPPQPPGDDPNQALAAVTDPVGEPSDDPTHDAPAYGMDAAGGSAGGSVASTETSDG